MNTILCRHTTSLSCDSDIMSQPASVSRSPPTCRELSISTGQHGGTSKHNIQERESTALAKPIGCPAASPAISRYSEYLKGLYERCLVSSDGKFPPTPSRKYINLAVVHHTPRDQDEVMKNTLHGKVNEILQDKQKISTEDICEPVEHDRPLSLVFIEGPPGIGKSTLAWELCRRWKDIPSMREYNLVVLLRLREKKIQQIQNASDLFPHLDCDLQHFVAKEVVDSNGKGVLFILDGFDELPSSLRHDGLLIDLITGCALPKSTVIVTSRPSATKDFLGPQICKRVEILGFTQECVKEYASSVFKSEPKLLDDFLTYVSASSNPAINSLMYVPLNAAIVVEVYRNSRKTGGPIPKTVTQLYTQLCLILLQRYLQNQSNCSYFLSKFVDLTDESYQHFLQLSQIAFEGLKKNQVIFLASDLPRDLIHFGFP